MILLSLISIGVDLENILDNRALSTTPISSISQCRFHLSISRRAAVQALITRKWLHYHYRAHPLLLSLHLLHIEHLVHAPHALPLYFDLDPCPLQFPFLLADPLLLLPKPFLLFLDLPHPLFLLPLSLSQLFSGLPYSGQLTLGLSPYSSLILSSDRLLLLQFLKFLSFSEALLFCSFLLFLFLLKIQIL
jgi:hypothetical protein